MATLRTAFDEVGLPAQDWADIQEMIEDRMGIKASDVTAADVAQYLANHINDSIDGVDERKPQNARVKKTIDLTKP